VKPFSYKGMGAALVAGVIAAAPLAAQENEAAAEPPAEEAIGPSELSGFNLQGTVTRPSPQPAEQAPAVRPDTAQPIPAQRAPAVTAAPPERSVGTAAPSAGRVPSPPAATQSTTRDSTPGQQVGPAATGTLASPGAAAAVLPPIEEGFSFLPWLAALLLAVGAGTIFLFLRRRQAEAAGVGEIDIVSPRVAEPRSEPARPSQDLPPQPGPAAAAPRHDPAPAPNPAPAAQPAPPSDGGAIVSTGLRPWLEVELTPDRALLDDEGAAIAFNVTLFNSGSAPARDVSIQACLINAGAQQDSELGEFYGRERQPGDTIPVIAPFARIPLRTAGRLPKDSIREYEVEGRRLFMPMVAVSTRYRWSSGEGQTGASFMVGKGKDEDARLAPLRTDQGPRSWQALGARRYEKGLRR
jgi:hypothetical protein